jgi:hypothetical protein
MTAGQPRGVLTWENYFRGEPQQPNDAREGVVMDWRRGRLTPKAPALIDLLSEFGSRGLPSMRTEKSVVRSMVGAPGLEPGTR